ncbi:MAG: hypothetical protein P8X42_02770 [Calditrichaceae bacterium]|jgi:hypothetical protein
MTRHLSEIEIYDYVQTGEAGLSDSLKKHLAECDYCRIKIKEQKEVDSLLNGWAPKRAPDSISRFVLKEIKKSTAAKVDWIFYFMLAILFVIAVFLYVSNFNNPDQSFENRKDQVVKFIDKNVPVHDMHIDDTVDKFYTSIMNTVLNFIKSNSSIRVALFAFIGFLFYFIIDQNVFRKRYR